MVSIATSFDESNHHLITNHSLNFVLIYVYYHLYHIKDSLYVLKLCITLTYINGTFSSRLVLDVIFIVA